MMAGLQVGDDFVDRPSALDGDTGGPTALGAWLARVLDPEVGSEEGRP